MARHFSDASRRVEGAADGYDRSFPGAPQAAANSCVNIDSHPALNPARAAAAPVGSTVATGALSRRTTPRRGGVRKIPFRFGAEGVERAAPEVIEIAAQLDQPIQFDAVDPADPLAPLAHEASTFQHLQMLGD